MVGTARQLCASGWLDKLYVLLSEHGTKQLFLVTLQSYDETLTRRERITLLEQIGTRLQLPWGEVHAIDHSGDATDPHLHAVVAMPLTMGRKAVERELRQRLRSNFGPDIGTRLKVWVRHTENPVAALSYVSQTWVDDHPDSRLIVNTSTRRAFQEAADEQDRQHPGTPEHPVSRTASSRRTRTPRQRITTLPDANRSSIQLPYQRTLQEQDDPSHTYRTIGNAQANAAAHPGRDVIVVTMTEAPALPDIVTGRASPVASDAAMELGVRRPLHAPHRTT